jgi:hypothetical protein
MVYVNNIDYCTSNFSFSPTGDPDSFDTVTAAHCSNDDAGHDFYTCYTLAGGDGACDYQVGGVATVYDDDDDFEVVPTSDIGYVWNDNDPSGTTYWTVNGWIEAAQGDFLTTDGATDGATFDVYVEAGAGADEYVTYGDITVDWGIVLEENSPLCAPGDSGGPMLEREGSSGDIDAAGIILGHGTDGLNYFCYGQQIYHIRVEAGLKLVWGG